jgi:hypothetical protein
MSVWAIVVLFIMIGLSLAAVVYVGSEIIGVIEKVARRIN